MSLTLTPESSLQLSYSCALRVEALTFGLRMALVQELRGEQYKPKATCPACSRKLTPMEIIRGFNRDPNDFTTRCPACGHRFQPRLMCFSDATWIELPFYCAAQVVVQLAARESFSPGEFAGKYPAVYRSAIVHFGSLRRAFENVGIGVRYTFREVSDWRNKIIPFLGRLPDTIIAACACVSATTIRRMRRKLEIPRYTLRKTLDEMET